MKCGIETPTTRAIALARRLADKGERPDIIAARCALTPYVLAMVLNADELNEQAAAEGIAQQRVNFQAAMKLRRKQCGDQSNYG